MSSNGVKKHITRRRDHLACIECRRKKLKCDRAAPCSACTRRDGGISCSYQRSTTGFEAERDRRKRAEDRLEHLEQLVQELSKSGQQGDPSPPTGTSDSATTTITPTNGSSEQENWSADSTLVSNETMYNGATHWSAMLEDIEELRSAISMPMDGHELFPQSPDARGDTTVEDSSILFGAGPTLTFEQVLFQYLPSRQESDRLIATYFRSKAVKTPFLHQSHFQRRYLAFWARPSVSPILWVSILFSVFHASSTSLGTSVVAENRYAVAAAHCLAVGKHYQPRRYAVEALLLYAQTKCFIQVDISPDIGSIFGLATRTAMRMGYHRDPARLNISPFEKEMRRRVWSTLVQLELLISFQLGQPSSILPGSWDSSLPANLQDADFDEDTIHMPDDRPDTEETDVMFYISKHKLSTAFEKVHQHVSSATSSSINSEAEVDALDATIKQTFMTLPVQYRQKAVSASAFDSPTLIVARFCTNMIHEKCLCVLHRHYVAAGRRSSVMACYEASSNIIRHIVDAYDEFQPGGQVELQKWFMSAITWHDFLLGATALCLVLCSASRHGLLPALDVSGSIILLERARGVLARHSAQSRDTHQVQKVVETVLARFTKASQPNGSMDTSTATVSSVDVQQPPVASMPSNGLSLDDMSGFNGTDYDWSMGISQPMIDESWNWLEKFLQDDSASLFAN